MNSCHANAAAWAGVAAGAPPVPLSTLNGGFSSEGTVLLTVIGRPVACAAGASTASPMPTTANPRALRDDTVARIVFLPDAIRSLRSRH